MKPGDRVRVTRGTFEGWHGPIVPRCPNDEPGWLRVNFANGETRMFPNDWLEPESPVVVRRTEAFVQYIQLRCPKCGTVRDNPLATSQDERGNFRNLVNAIGESTCDACRPKAATAPLLEYLDKLEATAKAATQERWTEVNDWTSTKPDAPCDTIEVTRAPRSAAERSSWPGEVHAMVARVDDECDNPDADRAHILATQPRATLALIAKLREAVGFVRSCGDGQPIEDFAWRRFLEIEVPS